MDKKIILMTAGFGGAIGGYLPTLLGESGFGGWSLLGAFVGGLIGVWAGVKLQDY